MAAISTESCDCSAGQPGVIDGKLEGVESVERAKECQKDPSFREERQWPELNHELREGRPDLVHYDGAAWNEILFLHEPSIATRLCSLTPHPYLRLSIKSTLIGEENLF